MTEDELLTAVLASPDEIGPRMVYADWLMTRGDLLGEFIVTQWGLRDPALSEARRQALRERELWLLEECGTEWLEVLGLWAGEAQFEGGLVEGVRLSSDRLLEVASVLATRMPVRSIEVVGHIEALPPVLRALARFPHLTSLKLVAMDLREEDLPTLTSWPPFARLHSLAIMGIVYNRRLSEHLTSSPALAGLRSLALSACQLDVNDAHAIAVSRHLTGLRSLDLAHNHLGDASMLLLAATPYLAGLCSLELDWNGLTDEGARALAASPFLSSLTSLSILSGNHIGGGALHDLCARFGSVA
jgi:uncharacterized protein (TIGR02996 family)